MHNNPIATPPKEDATLNQSTMSNQKNRDRRGGRSPLGQANLNKSGMEVSLDHGYLQNIDKMELQNQNYQIEIEKLIAAKAEEAQKAHMAEKEAQTLHERIAELEMQQDRGENIQTEKYRSLEFEMQSKN